MSIKEELKGFMKAKKIPQVDVAKALAISESTLSQWLNDIYPGDTQKIDESATNYLNRQKEKTQQLPYEYHFFDTSVSKGVFEIAKLCHIFNSMGLITGNAGIGKTTAIKQYAKNNQGVIILEANPTISSKRAFFQELHILLGMSGRGSTDRVFRDIVRALKDSERLLIIDEAEHIGYDALNTVHNLYDATNIGILLVGVTKLVHNLTVNITDYAHIYSRITENLPLKHLGLKDVENIITTTFPNTESLGEIFYAETKGNARDLFKLIKKAKIFANNQNIEVSEKDIKRLSKTILKAGF